MVNGIINVYKEKGFTSFDVVAKMRGIFHQKKIGHTGTLDPDATGVLPVCLGKATKVCDLLTDKDKTYEAVLLLGKETDTQDITGTVLQEAHVDVTEAQVKEAVRSFVGEILQIPPMYSALKVNGQKLCDLARQGIEVERKARPVQIYDITIHKIDLPEVTMTVHCSKGTYIRTLCHDIGQKLGCYGCMKSLVRTRVSHFSLENAMTLEEIQYLVEERTQGIPLEQWSNDMFDPVIQEVDTLFDYPVGQIHKDAEKLLRNGNPIPMEWVTASEDGVTHDKAEEKLFKLYDWDKHFIGLYMYRDEIKDYKPRKLFYDFS